MQLQHLTGEDLKNLEVALKEAGKALKKGATKTKLKMLAKGLITSTVIAGGVALTIIFPNPITVGVLGGVLALLGGNKGVKKEFRKIKVHGDKVKEHKADLQNIRVEMNNRKQQEEILKVLKSIPGPSAPQHEPIYPDLTP